MNDCEKRMLQILREGKANAGIVSVKAEFEAEGTRTDELLRLLEIARRADVKVGIKIGGCEAIRDLIECRQYGVDFVIAPMVETPYALSKYAAARNKVFSKAEQADIGFLFNVETATTFESLNEMAALAGPERLGMVFGRVDFAGSLNKTRDFVDSDDMTAYVTQVAQVCSKQELELVVGGAVSTNAIEALRRIRAVRLDRFETRKVIFDAAILDGGDVEHGLALAIEFELLWLKNKRDYYQTIGAEDETRIAMMEARQGAK